MNPDLEEFARQHKRKPLQPPSGIECRLCITHHEDSASLFEWPCLILDHWICETHCVEITAGFEGTHKRAAALLDSVPAGLNDEARYHFLLTFCTRCPYHGHTEPPGRSRQ